MFAADALMDGCVQGFMGLLFVFGLALLAVNRAIRKASPETKDAPRSVAKTAAVHVLAKIFKK